MRPTSILFLFLLLLVFFNPSIPFEIRKYEAPFVLLDVSCSMKDWNISEWANLRMERNYAFGESLRILKKPEFKDRSTNLSSALKKISRLSPSGVILITDGLYNEGVSPLEISLNFPVYPVIFKGKREEGGILSVRITQEVWENESVKVFVEFDGKKEVKILNGKEVLFSGKRERFLEEKFLLPPGEHVLTVIAKDTVSFPVRVRKKPDILLVTQKPDWDFKFLRRYFEKRPVNLDVFWKRNHELLSLSERKSLLPRYSLILLHAFEDTFLYSKTEKIWFFPPKPLFHPLLPILPGPGKGKEREVFDRRPPLIILPWSGIKPGGKVLFQEEDIPLVASYGKIVQFNFRGFYRYFLHGYREIQAIFDSLFFPAPSPEFPVYVVEGRKTEIPAPGPSVLLLDGKKIPAIKKENGYAFVLPPLSSGEHSWRLGGREGKIHVLPGSCEKFGSSPDTVLLKRLAEKSGGKVIRKKEDIPGRVSVKRKILLSPFRSPLYLLILLLVFTWDLVVWLRRR
ncbi:hypothetical protein DRQ18_03965 [bacterium]|nr:MAG: hypothetical protein DRQ18_03965 [bacterium]